MKDPYAVLGVARHASAGDIKKAYHRLAKRLHPDVNPGKPAIEQQFKEASAAYDLLSDPAKRARFDRGEIDASGAERHPGFRHADFRHAGPHAYRRAAEAEGVSFDEIIAELLGRKGRGGSGRRSGMGGSRPPDDAAQPLRLSFVEAARGGKRRVELADGRTVEVMLPAGIDSGQTLRLRNPKGAGETYMEIEVEPHPFFTRKDHDIHVEVPVTVTEAVLGGTITVPTIHGPVALKVPRGSNSGSTLRLKGKGIAAAGGVGGDQYVKLRVVLPDPPDPELTAFLERWADSHAYEVRGKLDPV